VEELPPQSVVPRGASRLGLGGTVAVVAMVALLAAGFGLLGGRPSEAPRLSYEANAPSEEPDLTPIGPTPSPLVTPWTECAEAPVSAPEITLQVGGLGYPGVVSLLEQSIAAPTAPVTDPPPQDLATVPTDAITELWVEGGACALAWVVDLSDGRQLDAVRNTNRDPGYVSQNRIALRFHPLEDGDHQLRAILVLQTLTVRATWPIRIEPTPINAVLHTRDGSARPVMGCDVTLLLGPDRNELLNPCVDDVGEPPDDAVPVRSGDRLEFELEGWRIEGASVVCGRLSGQSFLTQPRPGCSIFQDEPGRFEFEAPPGNARWTLALSACGRREASVGIGDIHVCGTWYANVVVTDRG
jgi:hypothetical protein